jgi:hypothetical protein
MPKSPKTIEETIRRTINALRDLAPDKKFSNKGLAELETQAEKSMAPRRKLIELANEEKQQIALRDAEDAKTMKLIDQIVAGVKGDDEFGDDSALYEALGFVRKSDRKSGNTRRRMTTETTNP